jgi:hypothetical protein
MAENHMPIEKKKILWRGAALAAAVLWTMTCALPAESPASPAAPEETPAAPPPEDGGAAPAKGVSLSPLSYQGEDFTDFFRLAGEAGDIVMWAGDWADLQGQEGSGARTVAELSASFGYIPLVEAQFFTQSSGALVRPLDEANLRMYRESAAQFARTYQPRYLGLGIEVNTLYEKSPQDFDAFAALFDEVYDAVKAASPGTKVFTVFQLERMKGLQGGLFGGRNDPALAQWDLLERFPKADLIAFTTYPCLVFPSPADMPAEYYAEAAAHAGKPIAFTEIGWHSAPGPAGWESSEDEQAEFVRTFFALTEGVNPEMAVWSFLFDPEAETPFDSMGLRRRSDGNPKPAWDAWLEA